jgi:hypothetical protein
MSVHFKGGSMNLAEKWQSEKARKVVSFPTSVRLRGDVDRLLQQVLSEFPHLNQTQIINDALHDSLSRVVTMI